MSTDLSVLQNQLPADIRAALAQQVGADLERLGAIGGKDAIRVTQDKKFELPNGDVLDSLDVVIVDFVYRNEFYPGVFNRKAITPPACFAISENASAMSASPNSPIKQGENCATCQQNQFGSSPSGDGKACKNTVVLAVLPLDATEDTPIWIVKSSPTAVKHFNAYVAKLARSVGVPVSAVTTKLFFDPNSTYASLRFDAIGANVAFDMTSKRKGEAQHRLMQEPDVSTFEMPGKPAGKK
jgi:hypothetical protein